LSNTLRGDKDDPVVNYEGEFASARGIAQARGGDDARIPIWLTECGVHLPASTAAPWSDMTPTDDVLQAAFIAPSFAAAQNAGVNKHFFFVLSNCTFTSDPPVSCELWVYSDRLLVFLDLENGLQYGLVRYDRTPRPGYSALGAVGFFFVGATALGKMTDLLTVSPAVAYAMGAQPGGGAAQDVVVLTCPVGGQPTCTTTPALLSADVQAAASVYDMLGREMRNGIPANVSATGPLFIVLPAGFASKSLHVIPPPGSTPAATEEVDIAVVLQSALPYDSADVSQDEHVLNATGGGHRTVFYAYNFGESPVTGTVTAVSSDGMDILPKSWTLTLPAGGRARFNATITPPGGRAAILVTVRKARSLPPHRGC